jgi:hypothetical protein
LGVNFSHVDAISGDFSHRIRPLAILRGERKVFSQSLDPQQAVAAARYPPFEAAKAEIPGTRAANVLLRKNDKVWNGDAYQCPAAGHGKD